MLPWRWVTSNPHVLLPDASEGSSQLFLSLLAHGRAGLPCWCCMPALVLRRAEPQTRSEVRASDQVRGQSSGPQPGSEVRALILRPGQRSDPHTRSDVRALVLSRGQSSDPQNASEPQTRSEVRALVLRPGQRSELWSSDQWSHLLCIQGELALHPCSSTPPLPYSEYDYGVAVYLTVLPEMFCMTTFNFICE